MLNMDVQKQQWSIKETNRVVALCSSAETHNKLRGKLHTNTDVNCIHSRTTNSLGRSASRGCAGCSVVMLSGKDSNRILIYRPETLSQRIAHMHNIMPGVNGITHDAFLDLPAVRIPGGTLPESFGFLSCILLIKEP